MKEKLSVMMSGENNPFFGHKHSEESKKQLSNQNNAPKS